MTAHAPLEKANTKRWNIYVSKVWGLAAAAFLRLFYTDLKGVTA